MATSDVAKPEVFTRRASGLVRVMSPYSAFVYNILTMGLIFPWTYLWAPGALPGGQLVWGILLAMLIEIPIAFAYVWLSTALPRSGGDYVFQSRVFGGGVAFSVVMSGYVIWILQWVALSGWLLAYLGFAPLFLGLGATLHSAGLTALGIWCTGATGIVIISILNALAAMLLLVSGFKNYVRFQYVMWYGTLLAFVVMLVVLFRASPELFMHKINAFVVASGGKPDFYQTAIDAAQKAKINLHPSFSLLSTLLIAPDCVDLAAMGHLQRTAERRDQERAFVPQSGHHHHRLADRHRHTAGGSGGCLRARHRYQVPVCRRRRLLVGTRPRHLQGHLSVAQHRRHGIVGKPAHRHHHRSWLHPEFVPDRQQLLYRHDAGHGGDVAGPAAAGMGQPRVGEIPHPRQRASGVLPGEHTGDSGVQPLGAVDRADPGRHLRLRLCVCGHLPGRCVVAIPGTRALPSLTRRRLQDSATCRWSPCSA